MISLAGLLLFAGIARFVLVTITLLHEPRVLMFHGRLAVAVWSVTCCTAVSLSVCLSVYLIVCFVYLFVCLCLFPACPTLCL